MKSARWALLIVLILTFICAGSSTSWTDQQLQVEATLIRTLKGHTDWVISVAFSPDGRLLGSGSRDDTIKLWDVATGQEVLTCTSHTAAVLSVAFSPNGKLLASGGYGLYDDWTIKLWEVSTGNLVHTLQSHTLPVNSVAFSPDGKLLASGSNDSTIKLWNVDTGRLVRTLQGHTDNVYSVTFSLDGRLLASGSGSDDTTIKLWNVSTRSLVDTLITGHTHNVSSVAFSPDGKLLASGSGDNTVKLWDVATGQEVRTLKGHTDYVKEVAFSPDGRLLASGGDYTIKLWNVSTGNLVYTLRGHTWGVLSVAFSPDGKLLASSSYGGTILLWQIQVVENQPPQARFTFSPVQPVVGQSIRFDASDSSDPDGTITDYAWNFGDGSTGSGKITTHVYDRSGTFTITLAVTDDDNASDSTSQAVKVEAEPAFFDMSNLSISPSSPRVGDSVSITAIVKNTGGSQDSQYIRLFIDDSEKDREWITLTRGESETLQFQYTFYSSGSYTVKVSSDDDHVSQTVKVIKPNKSPIASFTYSPAEPTDLDTIQFIDQSSDPDGEIVSWEWNFGDGSTSTKRNPTHQYDDDGTYTVKLTVTDDQGAEDTISQEITVLNVPPKAAFTFSPRRALVDVPTTFDASGSSDPDGVIQKYEWDFDDGATAEGAKTTHTFGEEGDYKVRLTVTDDDGASNSTEKEITVMAPEVEIKDRYAIIIGISDYQNGTPDWPVCLETLCDLRYSSNDAQDFYGLLVDPNIGDFPEEHVSLLLDEQATKAAITSAFGRLIRQAEEDDLVVIYYSGHGGQGQDLDGDEGDGADEYYIPYDYEVGDLFGTAIRDDEFGNWMNSIRSQHVIIFLDSCFSGGATKAIKGTTPPGYKAPPNNSVFNDFSVEKRLLISASRENERSFESEELGHGVFTHYLLEGLAGPADLDEDGEINADEVFEYVKPRVKEFVAEHWPDYSQTPFKKGTISPVVVSHGEVLQGEITAIAGNKEQALLGDGAYINLGSEDGVKVGDIFEVYHELKPQKVAVQPAEEIRGKIKVLEVLEEHRSLCEVIESKFPIEVGDKVRRANA